MSSNKIELLTPTELADSAGISVPYVYVLEAQGVIDSVVNGKHLYETGTVAIVREYMSRPRSGRTRDELGRFEPEIEY